MVILTQIAKNCEILLSPIFGSCLVAYISQKSGQPQVFSLFFPLFLPHLCHSLSLPAMILQQQLLFAYILSPWWWGWWDWWGIGTVGAIVGAGVSAGAGAVLIPVW
jgi:hypothetical protein